MSHPSSPSSTCPPDPMTRAAGLKLDDQPPAGQEPGHPDDGRRTGAATATGPQGDPGTEPRRTRQTRHSRLRLPGERTGASSGSPTTAPRRNGVPRRKRRGNEWRRGERHACAGPSPPERRGREARWSSRCPPPRRRRFSPSSRSCSRPPRWRRCAAGRRPARRSCRCCSRTARLAAGPGTRTRPGGGSRTGDGAPPPRPGTRPHARPALRGGRQAMATIDTHQTGRALATMPEGPAARLLTRLPPATIAELLVTLPACHVAAACCPSYRPRPARRLSGDSHDAAVTVQVVITARLTVSRSRVRRRSCTAGGSSAVAA